MKIDYKMRGLKRVVVRYIPKSAILKLAEEVDMAKKSAKAMIGALDQKRLNRNQPIGKSRNSKKATVLEKLTASDLSKLWASERYWIEEQDKGLPFIIIKAAFQAFHEERQKIKAEAEARYIAEATAKFGADRLEEALQDRSRRNVLTADIKKYDDEIANDAVKSIEAFERSLRKKIETRTRRNWG